MRLSSVGVLVSLLFSAGLPGNAKDASRPPVQEGQQAATQAAQKAFAHFLALNNQGKLKSAAAKNLLVGEAAQFAQVDALGTTTPAADAFQLIDAHHAVARVQGLNGTVPVTDVYFYLTLSGSTWKVSALRSLALTGIVAATMNELQKKPLLTAQDRQALANTKLTLSLDHDLRAYFKNHRSQFEQLRTLAIQKADTTKSLKSLGLSAIGRDTKSANILFAFVIGGISDHMVGYLYSPHNQPPKITPDDYIWVEKIADKWYLFRTT